VNALRKNLKALPTKGPHTHNKNKKREEKEETVR
jgi:hypothetical protein